MAVKRFAEQACKDSSFWTWSMQERHYARGRQTRDAGEAVPQMRPAPVQKGQAGGPPLAGWDELPGVGTAQFPHTKERAEVPPYEHATVRQQWRRVSQFKIGARLLGKVAQDLQTYDCVWPLEADLAATRRSTGQGRSRAISDAEEPAGARWAVSQQRSLLRQAAFACLIGHWLGRASQSPL